MRQRIERAYLDRLDGKISDEFWARKTADWQQEEQHALLAMQDLDETKPERILNGVRILELAK